MKPTSILGRYLTKQLLMNFFGVLLMIVGIILMFEMIELLRRTSSRTDIGGWFMLQMAFTKMPRVLDIVFPFVMMIAAMMTFWKFSKTNEYVVIRSAGVSVWGFLAPALFAVFVLGVLNVSFLNPLSAKLYETYETLDLRFKTKNPNAVLFSSKGLWIREALSDDVVSVLQAKSVRQDEESLYLHEVSVLEMDRDSQILRRMEAFGGILKNKNMELRDVRIFKSGEPTETLSSVKYETSLNLDRIKENFVEPDAISFWALPETIHFYEMSGFAAGHHKMRFYTLLVSPFLLCSMVLIASIFALKPNVRKGGVLVLIIGGIVTGFLVYFLSQVIYAFGINAYLPPSFAALTPSLVIILITVSVLLHLEDG